MGVQEGPWTAWLPLLVVLGGTWSSRSPGKMKCHQKLLCHGGSNQEVIFSTSSVPLTPVERGGGGTADADEARTWGEAQGQGHSQQLARDANSWAPPAPRESQCGMKLGTPDFCGLSRDLMHAKA